MEQQLDTRNLSDQLYDIILEKIVTGEYRSGQKLSANQMAQDYHISRSPVNDALNKLCGAGYVELSQRSGFSIRSISSREVAELFEYRKVLELHIPRRRIASSERHAAADKLHKLLLEMEKISASPDAADIIRFMELDEQFHACLISLLNNNYISASYQSANALLRLARIHFIEARNAWRNVMEEHIAIIDALEQGDRRRLEETLVAHNEGSMGRFLQDGFTNM